MRNKPAVLLIEDEQDYRENFVEMCKYDTKNKTYDLQAVGLGKQGFEIIDKNIRQKKKTLAFIDVILPDVNADELLRKKNYDNTETEGILFSAHKSQAELERIGKNYKWIKQCYAKPFNINTGLKIIHSFISKGDITPAVNSFDYKDLDASVISYLRNEASEIKSIMKRTVENTLEMGKKLTEVKKILPHGTFLEWSNREIGLHRSTVAQIMQVWEAFGHRPELICESNLNISIIYMLASRTVNEDFRSQILQLSESEEKLSFDTVKQLKKAYEQQESIAEVKDEQIESTVDIASSEGESDKFNNEMQDKQQIVKLIPKNPHVNKFYNLGTHTLFCGAANDPKFALKCPSNISLNIAFPDRSNLNDLDIFLPKCQTKILFQSRIKDEKLDLNTLYDVFKKSLEIYTNGGETVVFSYLPYPNLLLIAHKLGCNCYIAEPDMQRCEKIISAWNKFKHKSSSKI